MRLDSVVQKMTLAKFICSKEDDCSRKGSEKSGKPATIQATSDAFLPEYLVV